MRFLFGLIVDNKHISIDQVPWLFINQTNLLRLEFELNLLYIDNNAKMLDG